MKTLAELSFEQLESITFTQLQVLLQCKEKAFNSDFTFMKYFMGDITILKDHLGNITSAITYNIKDVSKFRSLLQKYADLKFYISFTPLLLRGKYYIRNMNLHIASEVPYANPEALVYEPNTTNICGKKYLSEFNISIYDHMNYDQQKFEHLFNSNNLKYLDPDLIAVYKHFKGNGIIP